MDNSACTGWTCDRTRRGERALPQDTVRIVLHTVGNGAAVQPRALARRDGRGFLYVPEGGVHAFHNESDELASMLLLFAPGAPREAYFEALTEIAAGRQLSDEEWLELCLCHDNYFI